MNKRWLATAVFSCLAVLGCDDESGAFEPLFGDDESLLHASFGSVALSGSDSEPIVVSVPANATSLAFIMSGLGAARAQPATIKNPSGDTVWEVGVTRTNRADAFAEVSTALVPVNPAVQLSEGDWEFVLFADASANADIDAVLRVDGKPSAGTIDLNLHFVGLEEIDATSAPDNTDIQDILAKVDSLYSAAGLSVGSVEYHDVGNDAWAVLSTSAIGSDELLDMLESETSGRDNRAVNVFLVADIENPGSSRSLLGVSGGVPGPGPWHGTKRSGVAVSMANYLGALEGSGDLQTAKDDTAVIFAHELGHYLGLFHTTEANGLGLGPASGSVINGEDPLSDTPLCPDSADSDGDALLSPSECSSADGSNLMFWNPTVSTTKLTSQQGEILRRNPTVR